MHANGLSAFTEVNPTRWGELTEAERARLERLEYLKTEQSGQMIQISRPQTLAHGLHDFRSGSWPGSWRSSRSGPIRPPNCPRTRWAGICYHQRDAVADRHRRILGQQLLRGRAFRSLGRE